MFYGCNSLKSIDLSDFDISSVTNMDYMFYGCDSLSFLDVSNFNMNNSQNYSNMFSNISNIKYLNLYNLTNDKIFADTFNETDDLYVCQKESIIPNAYNCCDYNYTSGECNSAIIASTLNTIETTQISTSENGNGNVIPDINFNEETFIVLLGFSHFEIFTSYFTFNIYFVPTKNTIYSNTLTFPVEIIYNSLLRSLQNRTNEANCTKVSSDNEESKIRYSCQHQGETNKIKQIIVNPNFTFGQQNNISLIGISPFASIYMNNLQDVQNKFNNLSNPDSKTYVLNNSLVNKYGNNNFNISGTINDPKPNYNNKAIKLNINVKKNGEETITELDCTISNTGGNNYTINCPSTDNINYEFQSASSYIDSDILVVNFANLNGSTVPEGDEISQYRKYNTKSSGGLNGGAIAAIIIVPIVVLLALVGTFFYIGKRKVDTPTSNDTTTQSIQRLNNNRVKI
jgi:surface protein